MEVNAIEKKISTELWHNRLGHMSEKGMQVLTKKSLLPGIEGTTLETCDDCLAGKQYRISFKRPSHSTKSNVLDIVYSDLCGRMKVKTLGGALYFLTFIDDHSRKVWAYALRSKNQVLDMFQQFQERVEKETRRKLKCIHTNNGGEYLGPFDKYCAV